jgi:ATP-dependent Clp protease ATP-binding subunit ClpC
VFERFTDHARKVMELAAQEAYRGSNKHIDTEHILMALIKEDSGVGVTVLKNLIDINDLRVKIEKPSAKEPVEVTNLRMPVTPAVKEVLEYAISEMQMFNDSDMGTQHILLGLLRYPEGKAASALADYGLNYEKVLTEVRKIPGKN